MVLKNATTLSVVSCGVEDEYRQHNSDWFPQMHAAIHHYMQQNEPINSHSSMHK